MTKGPTAGKPGKVTIVVDDNYHYMDESARRSGGSADDFAGAIAKCKRIVEGSLEECYEPGMTAAQLHGRYQMFGEDPFIPSNEPEADFSAWDYAKELSKEVVKRLGGEEPEDGGAGGDGAGGGDESEEDRAEDTGTGEEEAPEDEAGGDDAVGETSGDPPVDDPEPPPEPKRRSSRHFNYYADDWKTEILTCWKCGWKGTFEEGNDEVYEALMDTSCPNCDWMEAPILAIVSFPSMEDALANWGKLSAEERQDWLKRAEFERRLEEETLKSPDQLPEIEADLIELVWEYEGGLDDMMTVVRHGGREIWREPAVYEGYFRFKSVLEILEKKYGPRLVDLVPAEDTEFYLNGDNIQSLGWVTKWRDELRGRSARRRAESESRGTPEC